MFYVAQLLTEVFDGVDEKIQNIMVKISKYLILWVDELSIKLDFLLAF